MLANYEEPSPPAPTMPAHNILNLEREGEELPPANKDHAKGMLPKYLADRDINLSGDAG